MTAKSELVAILCFLALASGYTTPGPDGSELADDNCQKLEPDWKEKLDNMLAHLPESYDLGSSSEATNDLVVMGNATLTNLRKNLELIRPYDELCVYDERFIVFSMRCKHECLRITLPWIYRHTGRAVELVSSISELRLRVTIAVTGTVYEVYDVVHGKFEVDSLEINGGDKSVNALIQSVKTLFLGSLKREWRKALDYYLHDAFVLAAEESGLSR